MEKNDGDAGGFPGHKTPQSSENISDQYKAAEDRFYEKLAKLNESSGLGLVFNFRDTKLDLLRFYNEVVKRGGFYQVTKIGKWDEVASALNLNSSVIMSASQLQNIYEMLLFQYELLMCCPKIPAGKRKHCESSSLSSSTIRSFNHDDLAANYTCEEASEAAKTMQKKTTSVALPSSNVKESVMAGDAPQKPRSGYIIFLKLEANRLRMTHGESSNSLNLREMANNAWRRLPENEKQQYIEAGKMDKERYVKEMAAYKQLQNQHKGEGQISFVSNENPSKLKLSTSSETDDVYRVYLEDDEFKADSGIDHVTENATSGSVDVPYPMNDDWNLDI
ncbi:hypothetical protein CASFOL_035585 [Castilleja foliolosa]|uniref:Uncharacterized protein n=1 Tax=Castilleja foliolosa TaxID=1961234 RepID=A0ABD3BTW9_9LAMI